MNKIFLHITLTMILLSCISCADRDSSKHSSGSRNAIRFDIADISLTTKSDDADIAEKHILYSGATLDFTYDKTLGVYGNLADFGADDIFANETGRASTSRTSARCKFQTLTYRRTNCTGSKTIRQKTPNTIKAQT